MSEERPGDGEAQDPLSYQTPTRRVEWVSVWKPRNTMEANLAVATLQEHGIHARVDMENAADLGLPYAGVMYSKVQVLAQDAEAARKLLLEIDQQRARRQEAMSLKCPNCGTPDPKRILHPIRWAAWGALVGFVVLLALAEAMESVNWQPWLLLLIPAGMAMLVWNVTPRWRCKSCGHRWYAAEPEEEEDDEGEDEEEDEEDEEEEESAEQRS